MNKQRRMMLHKVLDSLERLRSPIDKQEALHILQEAQRNVESCMDDEQCALDSRPESFQFSATTTDMEDNINDLSDANDDLEIVVEECSRQEGFDYETIRTEITSIVHNIQQAINR